MHPLACADPPTGPALNLPWKTLAVWQDQQRLSVFTCVRFEFLLRPEALDALRASTAAAWLVIKVNQETAQEHRNPMPIMQLLILQRWFFGVRGQPAEIAGYRLELPGWWNSFSLASFGLQFYSSSRI